MSSQYYKVTAYVGTPHRNAVEVTIPLVGPAGATGAAGQGVPVGGTTGQVLRKASSGNYDTEWSAAASGSGSVTSIALAGTGLSISGSPVTTSGTITANVAYGSTAGTAAEGNDARLSDARTPLSHTHGNLTNAGAIGTTSGLPVKTGTSGVIEAGAFGTSAGQFAEGNHTHAASAITSGVLDNARVNFAAPAAIGNTTPAAGNFTTIRVDPLNGGTGELKVGSTTGGQNDRVIINNSGVTIVSTIADGSGLLRAISTTAARTYDLPDASGTIALTSDFAAPPAIGNTTPSTGAFTTLTATTSLTLGTSGILSGGTNLIEQVNSSNAQTFRIYNTFTSTTNFERLNLRWASNVAIIGTEKGSAGGTARALEFQTDGVTRMTITNTGVINVANFASLNMGTNGFITATGVLASSAALALNQARVPSSGAFVWYSGTWNVAGTDLELNRDAADVLAQRRGTAAQTFRIYNTVSGTSNVNFERANFRWASNEFIIDAEFGGTGTALRGIKLGGATSSLLGFFGATPVVQQAAVADATDAASTQDRLNDLLARLRTLGLIAT
jgi:hypothetical protein